MKVFVPTSQEVRWFPLLVRSPETHTDKSFRFASQAWQAWKSDESPRGKSAKTPAKHWQLEKLNIRYCKNIHIDDIHVYDVWSQYPWNFVERHNYTIILQFSSLVISLCRERMAFQTSRRSRNANNKKRQEIRESSILWNLRVESSESWIDLVCQTWQLDILV